MRELTCPETHPESTQLRCWKRSGHDAEHMTVMPNVDREVVTKPLVVRW